MWARFPQIVARLRSMLERFMTTLDCVDAAFIRDEMLDQLPLPSRLGKTRVGGVDLNNLRMRSALSAVLALAPSPAGFSTKHFSDKVDSVTGLSDADYAPPGRPHLKKLRAKDLIAKIGGSRRYELSTPTLACHHRASGAA